MTLLDRIRNALSDFESIEAHGGHMPGMLPETFSVEDLRVVVEMAGEAVRLREALGKVNRMLIIPAAEYVPAIPDCWAVIESALHPQDKTPDNTMGGGR